MPPSLDGHREARRKLIIRVLFILSLRDHPSLPYFMSIRQKAKNHLRRVPDCGGSRQLTTKFIRKHEVTHLYDVTAATTGISCHMTMSNPLPLPRSFTNEPPIISEEVSRSAAVSGGFRDRAV